MLGLGSSSQAQIRGIKLNKHGVATCCHATKALPQAVSLSNARAATLAHLTEHYPSLTDIADKGAQGSISGMDCSVVTPRADIVDNRSFTVLETARRLCGAKV